MKERDRLRVVLASLTAVLLVCCDAGKEPYKEAVGLDEKGQLREAAEKYDGVCRRNPKSELCPTATSRAGALRLKLALQAMDGGKFADAEKTLKVVAETGDGDAKTKAEAQLASKDLIQGLVYERAVGKTDKRAALKDIEAVAASGTPIAAKAAEWLTKERPPLLLADATAVCVPPTSTCPDRPRRAKARPSGPRADPPSVGSPAQTPTLPSSNKGRGQMRRLESEFRRASGGLRRLPSGARLRGAGVRFIILEQGPARWRATPIKTHPPSRERKGAGGWADRRAGNDRSRADQPQRATIAHAAVGLERSMLG